MVYLGNGTHRRVRSETRDNYIHQSLLNWAAYVRSGMEGCPRKGPERASWQDQVTERAVGDQPEYRYIDEAAAIQTHHAFIRCRAVDISTYIQLRAHYRDDETVDNLRKCRNRFWRFL